jgi:hypothetical protein
VGRAYGTHGRGEKRVQGFGGKARGKEPPERPRRRWDDGLKMVLSEIARGVWSGFTWLRVRFVGGSRECGDEPSGSGAMELDTVT